MMEISPVFWVSVFALLSAAGAVVLLWRALHWYRVFRSTDRDPFRARALARAIRMAIAGGCALAMGWGLYADVPLLIVVSGVILGEELLETTVIVAALEDHPAVKNGVDAYSAMVVSDEASEPTLATARGAR